MRRVLAGVLVVALAVAGCGGGGSSSTTSVLQRLPVTVNTQELAVCTKQLGMTDVKVAKLGTGAHKATVVGGHGPSGAAIAIAYVPDNPRLSRHLAREEAARYEVALGPGGTTIVITDPDATKKDREIVESCVEPND